MKKLKLNTLEMKNLSSGEMKTIMGGSNCYCACASGTVAANMNANYMLSIPSPGDTASMSHKGDYNTPSK